MNDLYQAQSQVTLPDKYQTILHSDSITVKYATKLDHYFNIELIPISRFAQSDLQKLETELVKSETEKLEMAVGDDHVTTGSTNKLEATHNAGDLESLNQKKLENSMVDSDDENELPRINLESRFQLHKASILDSEKTHDEIETNSQSPKVTNLTPSLSSLQQTKLINASEMNLIKCEAGLVLYETAYSILKSLDISAWYRKIFNIHPYFINLIQFVITFELDSSIKTCIDVSSLKAEKDINEESKLKEGVVDSSADNLNNEIIRSEDEDQMKQEVKTKTDETSQVETAQVDDKQSEITCVDQEGQDDDMKVESSKNEQGGDTSINNEDMKNQIQKHEEDKNTDESPKIDGQSENNETTCGTNEIKSEANLLKSEAAKILVETYQVRKFMSDSLKFEELVVIFYYLVEHIINKYKMMPESDYTSRNVSDSCPVLLADVRKSASGLRGFSS